MELDSIECVSSVDGIEEDEIHHHNPHHPLPHHHHQFPTSKTYNATNGILGPTAIAPATSVHELLECPVCTNSMYPPIHQFDGSGVGLSGFAELGLAEPDDLCSVFVGFHFHIVNSNFWSYLMVFSCFTGINLRLLLRLDL
ncbi:hypothetical protein SLEP1_g35013 [Rubroshorea leprosula]|uniref:Uncharacterized protein n=1 Tax=Rubroshorea leprosula TaxID=152421 RepID=A0AAV5KM72_9ROSI|nr:hypothetical protein SLEP1_g35013 [Rubroshorea leprosula]